VRVEGDAQLVQRVHELVPLLAPDLEHELSHVFGRGGAHVLTLAMRTAAGSVRRAAWTSVQNLAEYLSHETGDLVSRHEAEHFLRGVEHAREQLDRLEARLDRLERRGSRPT
jgi:ubiquinone biosynthesis protein UbiJ